MQNIDQVKKKYQKQQETHEKDAKRPKTSALLKKEI